MNLPPTNPPTSTKKAICPVISCLLKHEQQILILKRSKLVGSFQGYWSCVSGYLEKGEEPLKTAYREVFEETKIMKQSKINKLKLILGFRMTSRVKSAIMLVPGLEPIR